MRFISCHGGLLLPLGDRPPDHGSTHFRLGLEDLDALVPDGLSRGAVHEILVRPEHRTARFFGLVFARSAAGPEGVTVWCGMKPQLYPPAVAAAGVDPRRLFLIRPDVGQEEHWATVECLRCKGVSATLAAPRRLSHVEARRLQLAAEAGGGIGVLMRTWDAHASVYAASTRWLVEPAPGERTVQRWKVRLIHGHGGRVGEDVYLEYCREDHTIRSRPVREIEKLAAGSALATTRSAAG